MEKTKFRKKPVIIEAIQWNSHSNIEAIEKWLGDKLISEQREGIGAVGHWVKTLEGDMMISFGDWIIQGVNGEFYPCKPDIFEKTYEDTQHTPPQGMEGKYSVKGLNNLSNQFHQFQIDAGFTDPNITQRLMLVVSEIIEAFEAFRKDNYCDLKNVPSADMHDLINTKSHNCSDEHWKSLFESIVKDTFEDELADSFIRLLAFCGENGIDIENHTQMKMFYNELRGYKYGGKKF